MGYSGSTRRTRPVRSCCIMPCLMARVLSRRCSSAAISASHVGEDGGNGGLFVLVVRNSESKLPNLFRVHRSKRAALFENLPAILRMEQSVEQKRSVTNRFQSTDSTSETRVLTRDCDGSNGCSNSK